MSNPDMMRQVLDNPMVQNLMQNPEMMRQMIMGNPQMQQLMEVSLAHIWNIYHENMDQLNIYFLGQCSKFESVLREFFLS